MRVDADHVLAARMNAHRHQWNGTVCSQAAGWNCGAPAHFREDYCSRGDPTCFHLDVFRPGGARFQTPDPSVVKEFGPDPMTLTGQVLVFYGPRFGAQHGIAPREIDTCAYGIYRIGRAYVDESHSKQPRLVIEPSGNGEDWTLLPHGQPLGAMPRAIREISYLKQVRSRSVVEIFDAAAARAEARGEADGWTAELRRRFERVRSLLPNWLDALALPSSRMVISTPPVESPLAAQLRQLRPVISVPAARKIAENVVEKTESLTEEGIDSTPNLTTVASEPGAECRPEPPEDTHPCAQEVSATPDSAPDVDWLLPEASARGALVADYGDALIESIELAFLAKSLVVLTGAPGAGKSHLATHLLVDPLRERSVIVPVASTWRGREDLLGYVNPITGEFEPTEFTRFLIAAEEAWARGDRSLRLAVFEEFNLSQPEHWMSELLVRLEYEADRYADRTIPLGGRGIAGLQGKETRVILVPSLRIVATLNSDHTVKPLSPRVLDRAAIIEVETTGRDALTRLGVELPPDLLGAIEELDDLLAARGAGFSLRSARSLKRILSMPRVSMSVVRAVDFVLLHEVLPRVRLLAGDPRDEQLVGRLGDWSRKSASSQLPTSRSKIAEWVEALEMGHDIIQA